LKIYSLALYGATFYFLLFQEIILPPMDIQYPVVDLLSIGYPT